MPGSILQGPFSRALVMKPGAGLLLLLLAPPGALLPTRPGVTELPFQGASTCWLWSSLSVLRLPR